MATSQNALADQARSAVGEVRDQLQNLGEQAQERIGELKEAARERATSVQHDVESRIHENPMRAIMIAAGVGFVMGILWRR